MSSSSMKALLLHLLIAFSLTAMIPDNATADTDQQDVDALKVLYRAWSGKLSSTWNTSTDPCDNWDGIYCNNNTRVIRILLINQDLAGSLPSAIGNLTSLTDLDLSGNRNLGGSLPAEIGYLTNIHRFFVQYCNFSGPIPSEIGNMTNLQYLGLSQNKFSGPLPSTIGLLKEMLWLDVSGNNLNGSLPVSAMIGSAGSGLDNLTKALHFHLQDNAFSGNIPSSMFNTDMQLVHLLLDHNELTGSIPESIENLTHAEIICLDSNSLNGAIPSGINSIMNLTTLQLDHNKLTSPLPDLSNNTNLQMLKCGNNLFETSTIPSWITNMKQLYLLSMDSANLSGNIPAEIFEFMPYLSNVTLASNQLSGTLDLTNANTNLQLVNLTDNNITNVDKGNYTGELVLNGNPYCNSNETECTKLQISESCATSPSGSECTTECPSGLAINPGSCQCARPVVSTCTFDAMKIPLLTEYYIDQMKGELVTALRNNSFLSGLKLQDNQAVVDVLCNNVVNISIFPPNSTTEWPTSNLAGLISYVLKNQDIQFSSIGPLACGLTKSPSDASSVEYKLSIGAKIGIGVGVAAFVIAILVLGVYAMKQKRRAEKAEKLNKPFAAWIAAGQGETAGIPQLKGARWFSLEEIRKCTNNFSQSNEIGEGGYGMVYKGFLLSGDRVAIKRAGTSSLQGAAEFKNEIELLSRVHHRNLLGLIGFCFEEGEQMLVYEYMPNGTLREGLSGQTGLQMDWNRRIALALDSARGISYLHTEAIPPIIHGDIKSSNILLDEKLVAKVADFGLSKLAPDGDGVTDLTSQVKGTMGYLDPDYFMTSQLTYKSDVYSFGVVLLEVVTGRLPIERGKYIVHEVTTALAKGGMDLVVQTLVDPDLANYPLKDVERLVDVALNCLQDSPADRPAMAEVVRELEALVQVNPIMTSMNIDMDEERLELYGSGLPYTQQSYGTSSFEYSGSNVGMSKRIEPK